MKLNVGNYVRTQNHNGFAGGIAKILKIEHDEKPYVILVSPKTYINIREELENSNAWKYLAKLQDDKTKINYIFDIPVEISHYIIQEAICMNERDYKKYCEGRFTQDYLESKGKVNEDVV